MATGYQIERIDRIGETQIRPAKQTPDMALRLPSLTGVFCTLRAHGLATLTTAIVALLALAAGP
jgi:hypothetical protein